MSRVFRRVVLLCCLAVGPWIATVAQELITYKSAIVALADDPALRAEFEDGLAAKGRSHDYDAVASYGFLPDLQDISSSDFLRTLEAQRVSAVLMVRPAAVGEGSTLEALRDSISPRVLQSMRAFARAVSPSHSEEVIVVVHMAIYLITDHESELISSGAVWLDEEVESREQGIARLQDLIVANIDAVRPEIRRHLGLPPLR
jgi:hypothetical protein